VDEHGIKVLTTAQSLNKTPEVFLEELIPKWLDFCNKFRISFDNFYRTSLPDHHIGATQIWNICNSRGDIYKKYYEGLYCVGCEAFVLEKDLIKGNCPNHGAPPVVQSEENYFFRLSRYASAILNYLNENHDFIKPSSKIPELINFLKNLEDISISRVRENLPWGIEVPNDSSHTMYVWFDALTNYIRAVGFGLDQERFDQWWPGIQFCGPDNLRFQGAIWQGMLASAELPFSKKILVHGTILGPDNQKMSKTIGNVVAPLEQYEKYGSDVCRFYMLGVLRTYADCSYKEDELKMAYNAHLANNYGNLVNRLIHLSIIKDVNILDNAIIETAFKDIVDNYIIKIESYYMAYELYDAVALILEMVSYGNQHIHEKEPWKLSNVEASVVLNNVSYLLLKASELLEPIIPDGASKAIEAIKNKEKIILFPKLI